LILGTSARIAPQKKLEELILALRLANPRMPAYVVRIAGAPERGSEAYAEDLKARARAEGVPIDWLGEREDIDAFLGDVDLFVMISEPAGCPNASLEAMSAGLAVVATDVGGASEQVDDRVTGRLAPRADARALADAIVEAASDRERLAAWGGAGRARAERLFGMERMIDDYARVIGLAPAFTATGGP
jgi:glycosyltransferase involved in cell wall biosynthesis